MIGQINCTNPVLKTDMSGNMELSLTVCPDRRYAAKQILKDLEGKDVFTVTFSEAKSPRSLDQNALMWQLLTIYAEAQGGGRKGSVTPEEIYYRMLSKYGVAEYLIISENAVESLQRAYRGVEIVDNATVERNGKRTPGKLVKCVLGSSRYDTKEMSQVIDGVFDELAQIGVDASTSRELAEHYREWRESK